jgi:chemotaxis protein methyltransferase CheR
MPAAIQQHLLNIPVLSPKRFAEFSAFITDTLGIQMPASKRIMLQSRLQKRLRQLNLSSFDDYYDYVFHGQDRENELRHLLDIVTTNKTDFFREPHHYEVLVQTVLPELQKCSGAGLRRPLCAWSAGCSTGAEPYTLAMVLSDFSAQVNDFSFKILATDISTRVLATARTAIYEERDAAPIPLACKKKYLLRSKDRSRPRIRVAAELRRLVEFRRLNLMDADYGMREAMDLILCRNVMIYFNRDTQQAVLARLCRCLKPSGYLFIGHSETLNGFHLPLYPIATCVYQKHG